MKSIFRRLRGVFGNALAWAAAWFGASALVWIVASVFGVRDWLSSWDGLLQFSTEMAAVGFVMGGAFSAYLMRAFRNRRIEDLGVTRFTLGAATVTGLASIALIGAITWLQGWGWAAFRLDKLLVPIILPAVVLGGVTGFGSLKIAQRGMLEAGSGSLALDTAPERLPAEHQDGAP